MTNEQLKKLENDLWDSANAMRAYGGIKAADYAVPVLGLIFLRFAENKYSHFEKEIIASYEKDKGTRMERTIQEVALSTCGFYLPNNARYDYLLDLSGDKSHAKALKEAMEGIEEYQDEQFKGILPKDVYFEIEKKKDDILSNLLKTFSDIPKDADSDVFGKIYEYFLGKFALSEGQKGGEFFTPTSVVRFIVEVIEPFSGKIYDPACGSGGMFVQSADFVKHENHKLEDIYVCGQEYMGETVRLAKMNLLVNNIRGEIKEVNSYESDPHKSLGKFDFVMANPPFNVKSVKEATVKDDERFYYYGLPKNKGKKDDKITDANYLWISLFATSLNKTGRAGFVMPNSASDARNSEYEIRKKLVDSNIVDCMVSMPSNMFFTVTLPATLWFLDKNKPNTDRKDKILFLDARNVFTQIDRAHREWNEEQIQKLAVIVRLYRGETDRYLQHINNLIINTNNTSVQIEGAQKDLEQLIARLHNSLKQYIKATEKEKRTPAKEKALKDADFFTKLEKYKRTKAKQNDIVLSNLLHPIDTTPLQNDAQHEAAFHLKWSVDQNKYNLETLKHDADTLIELWNIADKNAKLKTAKVWTEHELTRGNKRIEEALEAYTKAVNLAAYWHGNIEWLQTRFPDAEYTDVVGLCKAAPKNEYVDEQDYSLNAGRYVGVEIEDDNITEEEFKASLKDKFNLLEALNNKEIELSTSIQINLKGILNE
ncbi:type I restriction-modification system subunit M [Plebeiibacterium marinum]|uniref:site-specific DNA-methyltransferase (adenine-specific) n=1 Tax=Plebeiibacterium marinum TaxID=2992111 RepID=A0AAE3SL25_9BACT|nr:type I restriction-modification system subunit M [Plebeiobacterium marinum]MCW3806125.1 type I restriction-modification system subunit M [Plebeiobacterium marinum]